MSYTAHKSLTSYIRQQTWPKITYPILFLVICIILLLVFPDVNHHPKALTSLAESRTDYTEDNRYVTLSVDTLYYSGLNYEDRGGINARVYYAFEDDICYYFILDEELTDNGSDVLTDVTLNAVLDANHIMFEEICASMSASLAFAESNLAEVSSTILFNQYEYSNGFLMFCFIGLYIVAFLNLVILLYLLLVILNPALSVSVRPLRRYGKAATLYAIAAAEFDSAIPTGRRNIYVTETFLIVLLTTGIIIQPLANITWLYQTHEVRHRHGTARMYHTLCVVTDKAKILRIPRLSEPVIATLISTIAGRFPQIHIGNGGME